MTDIYIGVDLGYRDATTIVIVRPGNDFHRFVFSSLREGTEFPDIVDHVVKLMVQHNIHPKNLSAPRHPAFEKEVSKRFGINT